MPAKKPKKAEDAAAEFCRLMQFPSEMRPVARAAFFSGAAWAYKQMQQGIEKDHERCSRRISEIFNLDGTPNAR